MANKILPCCRALAVVVATLLTILGPPAFALAQFIPLDPGQLFNTDRDTIFNGNLLPIGPQQYDGVPFRLTYGRSYAWTPPDDANPHTLEVPVNVYGVHTVHTLLNTKWGQPGPKSLAAVEFYGTGNRVHRVELIGGVDMRDHFGASDHPQSINGTTTVEAFKHKRGVRLDKQRFVLPARFQSDTLRTIKFIDKGAQDKQRLLLVGITAEVPVPQAARPKLDAASRLQGEYVFQIEAEDNDKLGVQVVALGDEKLRAMLFRGGLPGEGWDRSPRTSADAAIENGRAKFALPALAITIADDSATIAAPDGRTLGTGRKVNRKSRTLGAKPPAGATVLFADAASNDFPDGRLADDESLLAGATSKHQFRDGRLHVEFLLPYQPDVRPSERGISGVFLQGRYEVHISDSFGLAEGDRGTGALGNAKAPDVNMCFPPNTWQTFDIDFVAAKYDGDRKTADARATVRHNGVLIQDNVALREESVGRILSEGPNTGPLWLQPHDEPVRFRNIWIAPYAAADQPEPTRGDRMPAVGKFADFLNQQERAAKKARNELLQAIQNRAKVIRRSKQVPDGQKRIALDAIEKDRTALATNDTLPTSDELIDLVIKYIDNCQQNLDECESFRQKQADKAVRIQDAEADRRLQGIEEKIQGVIGGQKSLTAGSKWIGSWRRPDRAFEMEILVNKVAGNTFTGELIQKGDHGRPARMNLSGNLNGNRIQMQTTGMIQGKSRDFSFQGYLLGTRIVADVDAITTERDRVAGWLSVSRK